MKKVIRSAALLAVCFICLLSVGCAPGIDLDEKIVVIDGKVFELRHRILDTYLLYSIDEEELRKMQQKVDDAKR